MAGSIFRTELAEFLDGLVSHYVLDDGKLVVAHAGMKAEMQGRGSGRVRDFALYGETTGETDEFGLPVRYNWAAGISRAGDGRLRPHAGPRAGMAQPDGQHRHRLRLRRQAHGPALPGEGVRVGPGRADLLRAGPPVPRPTESARPRPSSAQQVHDEVLDADDVLGKRIIPTRLRGNVTIREENAAAALEVMSRFAADPRWLIYLPPTMSPCETSGEAGSAGAPGRGVCLLPQPGCAAGRLRGEAHGLAGRRHRLPRRRRGAGAVRRRRRASSASSTTRTGRRFFNDPDLERAFLDRVRAALDAAGLWAKLETTWACLDCELMPWSAKAQELLRTQYAAVGVGRARPRCLGPSALSSRPPAGWTDPSGKSSSRSSASTVGGEQDVGRFVAAYRQYCWPVNSLADLKLAPFHLLATEGRVHTDKDHLWHMETLAEVCRADPELLLATPYKRRGRDRPREPVGGHRLVGGADRAGRRGDGRQAAGVSSIGAAVGSPSPP